MSDRAGALIMAVFAAAVMLIVGVREGYSLAVIAASTAFMSFWAVVVCYAYFWFRDRAGK